jgi:hypothetical protein
MVLKNGVTLVSTNQPIAHWLSVVVNAPTRGIVYGVIAVQDVLVAVSDNDETNGGALLSHMQHQRKP